MLGDGSGAATTAGMSTEQGESGGGVGSNVRVAASEQNSGPSADRAGAVAHVRRHASERRLDVRLVALRFELAKAARAVVRKRVWRVEGARVQPHAAGAQ